MCGMTTAPRTLKMTGIECSGNDGFTQPTAACAQSISAIQTSKRNEKPISETNTMISFSIRL